MTHARATRLFGGVVGIRLTQGWILLELIGVTHAYLDTKLRTAILAERIDLINIIE